MMVQTSVALHHRCRSRFETLQGELEKLEAKSKISVASRLLFFVESRYLGVVDYPGGV